MDAGEKIINFGLICALSLLVLFLYPSSANAQNRVILRNLEFVEFTGRVMNVDVSNGFLVVAERKVAVVFKIGAKSYQTPLKSRNKRNIHLLSFDKGDKVHVKGVQFPDGLVAASLVLNLSRYHFAD